MSRTTNLLDEATRAYLQRMALTREDATLARLRQHTAGHPQSRMQISVEQGRLLALMARTVNARWAIEVGVFTGYSALCVAQTLPADGKLIACDLSEEYTAQAIPFWQEAGVADRIDLRLGPASQTLHAMIAAGEVGHYDFAFIDADKVGYPDYYEQCLTLLRPGGGMALDNIFLHGNAVAPADDDPAGQTVHTLTQQIFADERVDPALIPIGDGVILLRKR